MKVASHALKLTLHPAGRFNALYCAYAFLTIENMFKYNFKYNGGSLFLPILKYNKVLSIVVRICHSMSPCT